MKSATAQSSLLWAVTGPVGRMVAQLGAQVVLARLLVPADYGVFSILLLTITLAGYFGELGGAALLVKK